VDRPRGAPASRGLGIARGTRALHARLVLILLAGSLPDIFGLEPEPMVSQRQEPPGQRSDSSADYGDYQIEACVLTDSGCQRENNEDAIGWFQPDGAARLAGKGALAIVADYIRTHRGGAIASRAAVSVVSRLYYENQAQPAAALAAAFQVANREIYAASQADPALKGMGTTCTALALRGEEAFFAHIGDSRLYRVREGRIELLTEDHTAVAEMLRHGVLTPDEARKHADRHVLARALGVSPQAEAMISAAPLPLVAGDCFVLSSDGLHDLVEDEEIERIVAAEDSETACARLLALARERGGYDNISVGVLGPRGREMNSRARPPERRAR